jgi:hypothetical protein
MGIGKLIEEVGGAIAAEQAAKLLTIPIERRHSGVVRPVMQFSRRQRSSSKSLREMGAKQPPLYNSGRGFAGRRLTAGGPLPGAAHVTRGFVLPEPFMGSPHDLFKTAR